MEAHRWLVEADGGVVLLVDRARKRADVNVSFRWLAGLSDGVDRVGWESASGNLSGPFGCCSLARIVLRIGVVVSSSGWAQPPQF